MNVPLPCPFCGSTPVVEPADPKISGNAWGAVRCVNEECTAKPVVRDGENISDDRGSDVYKSIATARWNKRF